MMFSIPKQTFSWWVRRCDTALALGAFAALGKLLPVPEDTGYAIHYLGDPWWIASQGPVGEQESGLQPATLSAINSWYSRALREADGQVAGHYFRLALLNLRHCGVGEEHLDATKLRQERNYLTSLCHLDLDMLYPPRPIIRGEGPGPARTLFECSVQLPVRARRPRGRKYFPDSSENA